MINIIFAPPRTGKTSYMTHCLNEYAYNYERYRAMNREIELKNVNGFKLTVPGCCVSANYDLMFRKFGYSRRVARRINPYRLGFKNEHVRTHFNFPHEVIGITEGQKYLNSRMSLFFPDWQSRWYEQHGHNDLDILIDTQRPGLIDLNIRELAMFTEILSTNTKIDKLGRVCEVRWVIREIPNHSLYELYISSGKCNTDCFVEREVISHVNVFSIYDSQSCKPKFYEGHFDEDFDVKLSEPSGPKLEDYVRYLERFDDELPKGFYQKPNNVDKNKRKER